MWVCVWVAALGIMMWGARCLCREDKMVVNAAGLGMDWLGFGWPNGGECSVMGNWVPILMYICCE